MIRIKQILNFSYKESIYLLLEHKFILLTILVLLIIKLPALFWGFPGTLHNDESNVVRSSLGLRFNLNPGHFDWPSLYFYINYFFFYLFIKFRIVLQLIFGETYMKTAHPLIMSPDLSFYVIARFIAFVFCALNNLFTYIIALKLSDSKKIAYISALFLGIGLWNNHNSFLALSDNAVVTFGLISFYFSLNIVSSKKYRNYFLAALFAGLSASVKYNGIFILISTLYAHLLREKTLKSVFNLKLISTGFIAIIAFLVGTPYAILDYDIFSITTDSRGAFWQFYHMGHGYNWSFYLLEVIPQNFGGLIFILAITGFFYAFRSKLKTNYVLLLTLLTLTMYIGYLGILRAHYILPVLPFIAILGSFGYEKLINDYKFKPYIQAVFIFTICIIPITNLTVEIVKRSKTDTRIMAGNFIESNIPKNSNIAVFKPRTGFFGGDLPVFEWDEYNVSQIEPESNLSGFDYTIYTLNSFNKDEYKEIGEVYYYQDNNLRTGPKVLIIKNKLN